jgi:GNAT superfamily N-acetyltransferase
MRLAIPAEQFWRLPRHPDWKYEYVEGSAWLSPRARPLPLVRQMDIAVPATDIEGFDLRKLAPEGDRRAVASLLASVWAAEDPFCSFNDGQRERTLAAEIDRSLARCQLGAVALADSGEVCGAVLAESRNDDLPTLTWLTVRRGARDRGLATALLGVVVDALVAAGATRLASAASVANVASLRWHLSRGFELAPDPIREALRGRRR